MGGNGQTNNITVSGLIYQVNWTSTTPNFSFPNKPVYDAPGNTCAAFQPANTAETVVNSITLPNGEAYQFYYGTNNPHSGYSNPYGLLNEIDYPTGAWVRYTWTMSTNYSEGVVYDGTSQTNGSEVDGVCQSIYSTPVIATRSVGLAGSSTPIQTQTFTYQTQWNSDTNGTGPTWSTKQTTVVTTDNIRGLTSQMTYAYTPFDIGSNNPYIPNVYVADQLPLEQTVQYYNWGNTTTPIRTVTKVWHDQFELTSEQDDLANGQTSKVAYTYAAGALVSQKNEYDYGTNAPGNLLRSTVTNYQSFPVGPIFTAESTILDRPCQVITYDGNSNRYAETDYFYDSGATSTVCGTAGSPSVSSMSNLPPGTHDETNYGPSSTNARGNLTQKTQWVSSGTSPVTTYSYDETGQILTIKDPCGNSACSDMSGTLHTTTFGYSNNFTVLSSSTGENVAYTDTYNTDTYLTAAVNALGQNEKFSYDYYSGQLTASQDQNDINAGRSGTTYIYNDSLNRPTQINYPDAGQTSLSYVDSSTPSMTTTKLVSSSVSIVNTTTADGFGRPTSTELSSDPDGPTYTTTTYDGMGKAYEVYNPTRCNPATTNCGAETTWGVSTYSYDALGRTTSVTDADSSSIGSTYDQTCTVNGIPQDGITVTDEVGSQRQSCSDGLGRMTAVFEAPNVSGYNFMTSYQYNPLNDLINVTQNGSNASNARIRNFTYDSLSRLTGASNPESGSISYTYDANGNVATRVAPQADQTGTAQTTTTYTYDALNRVIKLAHTNPPASAGGNAAYSYDGTAISGCPGIAVPTLSLPTNLIGRRSSMCSQESTSNFSYDPMGRLLAEAHSIGLSSVTTFNTGYTYYKDGSLDTLTYPSGDVLTYAVGGAGRPLGVSDSTNTYVAAGTTNHATYAPQGGLASMTNGYTSAFAGVVTSNTYNARLQPLMLSASTADVSTSINAATYNDGCSPGCTATYYVSSSTGINVGDTVTVTGNSNSILNGHFTVSAVASGTVTVDFSDENGGKGDGGTMTDNTSGLVYSLCYDFHMSQAVNNSWPCNLLAYTTGDNGNVFGVYNNANSNLDATYSYDALNRIKQANTINTTSSNCWGEAYTIDAWGNMTNIAAAPGMGANCTTETLNAAPANTANQLTGYCYDAAGNLSQPGTCPSGSFTPTYYYDAENRMVNPAATYSYFYDADGVRIRKAASATEGTMYWTGPGGEYLTETNGSGTINEEYVFFNGDRIARVDRPSGTVHYYFSDQLKSTSLITSASGALEEEYYYYPYGGMQGGNGSDTNHYLFTGKERDNESGEFGFDYFGARYYANTMGRFLTTDPLFATPFHVVNPQRWNMYAYVMNNPTNYVDPDGEDAIAVNFTKEVPVGGHEGIIVVHADGSATYARFGPVTPASPADAGKVVVQALQPVALGADGLPTGAAYKQLSEEVAKIEGQPADTVRMNYFKTSEADSVALDNWMKQWKTAHVPDYDVTSQNCAVFCIAGLMRAHVIGDEQKIGRGALIPNRLFSLLSSLANENWVGQQPKERVTTRICWTDANGNKVCQ